jgi:Grx4 family monothiol glutaredoxin
VDQVAKMVVLQIRDNDQFEKTIGTNTLVVIHFMAPWAAQCQSINNVLKDLSELNELKEVAFAELEAEHFPEVCLTYNVISVPTVLYFRRGEFLDRVDGVKVAELTNKVKSHLKPSSLAQVRQDSNINQAAPGSASVSAPKSDSQESSGKETFVTMEERLKSLINRHKVMIFMKGTPDAPRCGFSRTIIEIIRGTGVAFGTFDILSDEEVRQNLKTYSDWHTYPQVYVNGELVGGLDIVKELQENGELYTTLIAQ